LYGRRSVKRLKISKGIDLRLVFSIDLSLVGLLGLALALGL